MKISFVVLTLVALLLIIPQIVHSYIKAKTTFHFQMVEAKEWDKEAILELIHQKSLFYGVSEAVMVKVVTCENPEFDPKLQSYVIESDGKREESWGIAQWHIPSKNRKKDGSIITKEDALNPELALDNMAWYFSRGLASRWTCYRMLVQSSIINQNAKNLNRNKEKSF